MATVFNKNGVCGGMWTAPPTELREEKKEMEQERNGDGV